MSKTSEKAAEIVEETVEATEKKTARAGQLVRKGALAYVGLYGAAYDRFQLRREQFRKTRNELFETLVEKGEEIETKATAALKDTQSKVQEQIEDGTEKVRSVLPKSANNRVAELEAEVAKLNKKIATLSRKAKSAAKTQLKTEKTEATA